MASDSGSGPPQADASRFPVRDAGLDLPPSWVGEASTLDGFFRGPFLRCGVGEGFINWGHGSWERHYEVQYPRAPPEKLLAYVTEQARNQALTVLDPELGRNFGKGDVRVLGNIHAVRVAIMSHNISLEDLHKFFDELPSSGEFDRYRSLITDVSQLRSVEYRRMATTEEIRLVLRTENHPGWVEEASRARIPRTPEEVKVAPGRWSHRWYDRQIIAERSVPPVPGCEQHELESDDENALFDAMDE